MHWEKLDGVEYTLWAVRKDGKDALYADLQTKGILEEMERMFVFKESRLGVGKKAVSTKKQFISNEVQKTFRMCFLANLCLIRGSLTKKML